MSPNGEIHLSPGMIDLATVFQHSKDFITFTEEHDSVTRLQSLMEMLQFESAESDDQLSNNMVDLYPLAKHKVSELAHPRRESTPESSQYFVNSSSTSTDSMWAIKSSSTGSKDDFVQDFRHSTQLNKLNCIQNNMPKPEEVLSVRRKLNVNVPIEEIDYNASFSKLSEVEIFALWNTNWLIQFIPECFLKESCFRDLLMNSIFILRVLGMTAYIQYIKMGVASRYEKLCDKSNSTELQKLRLQMHECSDKLSKEQCLSISNLSPPVLELFKALETERRSRGLTARFVIVTKEVLVLPLVHLLNTVLALPAFSFLPPSRNPLQMLEFVEGYYQALVSTSVPNEIKGQYLLINFDNLVPEKLSDAVEYVLSTNSREEKETPNNMNPIINCDSSMDLSTYIPKNIEHSSSYVSESTIPIEGSTSSLEMPRSNRRTANTAPVDTNSITPDESLAESKNYKSALQVLVQAWLPGRSPLEMIQYTTVEVASKGPNHSYSSTLKLTLLEQTMEFQGYVQPSKREAEQSAAKLAFESVKSLLPLGRTRVVDHKGELNKLASQKFKTTSSVVYTTTEVSDKQPARYQCIVTLGALNVSFEGKPQESKKAAEQSAAELAVKYWRSRFKESSSGIRKKASIKQKQSLLSRVK